MPTHIRIFKDKKMLRVQRLELEPVSGSVKYTVEGLLFWFSNDSGALIKPVLEGRHAHQWDWNLEIIGISRMDTRHILTGLYDVIDDTQPPSAVASSLPLAAKPPHSEKPILVSCYIEFASEAEAESFFKQVPYPVKHVSKVISHVVD